MLDRQADSAVVQMLYFVYAHIRQHLLCHALSNMRERFGAKLNKMWMKDLRGLNGFDSAALSRTDPSPIAS